MRITALCALIFVLSFATGNQLRQHLAPRTATYDDPLAQKEQDALTARLTELATLKEKVAKLELDIAALKLAIPPTPNPVPTMRTLKGGWRLACEFARGTIAIDFASNRLWLAGHEQRNDILEFALPPKGIGTDPAQWPALTPTRVIPGWWSATEGNAYGLAYFRGKLWCSPRLFYDTAPPQTLTLYAQDGEKISVPLPRQQFAGFVKRAGQEPLLGGGGYESGQGWSYGPTLARIDGTRLISNTQNPAWESRSKREPNYFPKGHIDSWVALEPRTINSKLEGRWACDRIQGGGLVLPEGVTYFVWTGTGEIDYDIQNDVFSRTRKTYQYRHDATTYALKGWEELAGVGKVGGQDVDAQGRVYLCETNVWKSGLYQVDPCVRMFE